jgi:hypothetical protein
MSPAPGGPNDLRSRGLLLVRRPSKAMAQITSARDLALASDGISPGSGRYHSTTELTRPNSSRAVISASTSGRMSPSRTACSISSATNRSKARRWARAARSTSVLPRTRSSSVT